MIVRTAFTTRPPQDPPPGMFFGWSVRPPISPGPGSAMSSRGVFGWGSGHRLASGDSSYPSPKAPATGSQVDDPKTNWGVGDTLVLVCRKKKVVPVGRNTAGVSIPSTIPQSPAISPIPGSPKTN